MTGTSIPLTFRAAPLPEGYKADPEQFKNDIVARLYAESGEAISFFASGSVAPSSNVGPWLKNGTEWYVWSDDLAMYVPITVTQASLKWIAQFGAPDQAIYTFWIELNGSAKAIAIKYYSGGAWKDIYEDTFAAITASRAAGDAATLAAANAYTNAAVGGISISLHPGTSMALGQSDAPNGSTYAISGLTYVAPVTGKYAVSIQTQIDNSGGAAGTMQILVSATVNGSNAGAGGGSSTPNPVGGRWFPNTTTIVDATAGDTIGASYQPQDGVGAGTVTVSGNSGMCVNFLPS